MGPQTAPRPYTAAVSISSSRCGCQREEKTGEGESQGKSVAEGKKVGRGKGQGSGLSSRSADGQWRGGLSGHCWSNLQVHSQPPGHNPVSELSWGAPAFGGRRLLARESSLGVQPSVPLHTTELPQAPAVHLAAALSTRQFPRGRPLAAFSPAPGHGGPRWVGSTPPSPDCTDAPCPLPYRRTQRLCLQGEAPARVPPDPLQRWCPPSLLSLEPSRTSLPHSQLLPHPPPPGLPVHPLMCPRVELGSGGPTGVSAWLPTMPPLWHCCRHCPALPSLLPGTSRLVCRHRPRAPSVEPQGVPGPTVRRRPSEGQVTGPKGGGRRGQESSHRSPVCYRTRVGRGRVSSLA